VPSDDERRTGCSSEHVLNYRAYPESIGAGAMGGTQHDQVWLASASMQQNDLPRLSVLDIDSDLHTGGLRSGAKLQEVSHSFRGPSVKGLVAWNAVDDDHFRGVGARQGEGLRKGGESWLVNIHCTQHAREPFHDFALRC
jgi:hypothetical protein